MKQTIDAHTAAGMCAQVKVMIGGGTIDAGVCKYVGADDRGNDPMKAIRLSRQWMGVTNV